MECETGTGGEDTPDAASIAVEFAVPPLTALIRLPWQSLRHIVFGWNLRDLFVTMRVRLPSDGPVAQLGARLNGIQEVTGSIPVRSTILRS